jgi:hypothetical protein
MVAAVLIALTLRLFVAFSDRGDPGISVPEILLYTLVGSSLVILGVLMWGARRPLAGLSALRASQPESMVIPLIVQREDLNKFGEVTGIRTTSPWVIVTCDETGLRFWSGARPREVAAFSWETIESGFDRMTTAVRSWPCLFFERNGVRVHALIANETSFWFARSTKEETVQEVARQIQARAA